MSDRGKCIHGFVACFDESSSSIRSCRLTVLSESVDPNGDSSGDKLAICALLTWRDDTDTKDIGFGAVNARDRLHESRTNNTEDVADLNETILNLIGDVEDWDCRGYRQYE
eukprot:CAMPEP_0198255596 /NCGR_PEP_ID=MMETSP1447-20131203/5685_1 /TAXON_ID=420782 /ORGANISM="Chaetoceros dichaeta, Strain CCMP1751" /LENGTH=110 /DNA_ID=CAMNT_0043942003 /DNA_START=222 /DNA_END=554 /DNA_ORIENTATION=-